MIDDFLQYLNTPDWRKQHNWRRAIWMNLHRLGLTGVHALPVNRRWVDIHRRTMPMAGLDPALEGLRIVQISDLHYSPVVWRKYLTQHIGFINDLEPDLVVVTGDLITGGYRYVRRIAELLSTLKAPMGIICTFGNHDYGMRAKHVNGDAERRGDLLASNLREHGLIVLRNQTHYVRRADAQKPLAIVGLDDLWTGRLNAAKAFKGVDPNLPIICLNHNPVNAKELLKFPWQWMLSGHTHGRQVGASRLGRRLYPHRYRHFTHGLYSIEGRNLYVNRGLSYGKRFHHWCRPEITVFKVVGKAA